MVFGAAGLLHPLDPADAARPVRDGRPFHLLRADQICGPAAASAARTRCSAAPAWSRPAPMSRSWWGRSPAACVKPPVAAPECWLVALCSAGSPGGRCRRRRPSPTLRSPRWTGTSSAPRSRWSAPPCTSRGCSSPSPAISFFWMMGAILAAQFPPLVKNVFNANEQVATLFLAIFSVGVGLGSVLINRLLKGRVAGRLFARLGDRDGAVHLPPLLQCPRLAGDRRRADRRQDLRPHPARPNG